MPDTTLVTCPSCGSEFSVEEIFSHELEEKFRDELNSKIKKLNEEYGAKEAALSNEKEALQLEKVQLDKTVSRKVSESIKAREDDLNAKQQILLDEKEALTAERGEIDKIIEQRVLVASVAKEQKIREKVESENEVAFKALCEEREEDKQRIRTLSETAVENEKLKRQLRTQESDLELKYSKQMTEQLQTEIRKAQDKANEGVEMKLREKDKRLEDANAQVTELKRRLEQSSTQLQGEVQELAIEEWLSEQFPLDEITEIKKWVRGADCLHIVNTRERTNCGKIYYESKRAKDFQKAWITKFRDDMRAKGADIGVLVTEVMPPDMERMGTRDGILICNYDEFKGVCFLLREQVIAVNSAYASQEGKGDKMTMIYDYLTGNEFRMSVEAIVEAFTQMKVDLDTEKRAFKTLWAKREKQIDKVVENTMSMFGSIRGLGGTDIQNIPALEVSQVLELESGSPTLFDIGE